MARRRNKSHNLDVLVAITWKNLKVASSCGKQTPNKGHARIIQTPEFRFFFRVFDILMTISRDLHAKAYLRYWNFALTSIPSSNRCFDRFPSKFSKIWAPLQEIFTFSRQVQFPSRENHFFQKFAWEPVETPVWRYFWGQCEISVSKIGFSIQIYWNNHRNIKKAETISKMGDLRKNEHFFCFLLDLGWTLVWSEKN